MLWAVMGIPALAASSQTLACPGGCGRAVAVSRPPPPQSGPEQVRFDSTLLVRYSARTFNGRRFHYDADHARGVGRYAAPVVHGPLLAQLLRLKVARVAPLARFALRGIRALTLDEAAILCREDRRLWVQTAQGQVIMEAQAEWA